MKVFMHHLAEHLQNKGFNWKDIDDPKIDAAVLEYLADEGLFDQLYEEMLILKQEQGEE